MQHTNLCHFIAGLALVGSAGCETYELPPRLHGVATDECPECEVLELSETRLPPGDVTLTARFAFEDEWGAVERLQVFVTSPGGEVLKEPTGEKDANGEPVFAPGFTCAFVVDFDDLLAANTCTLTALHFRESGTTLLTRLRGVQGGELTARFGLNLDEIGTWTVEVEAVRETGAISNRISETFEVAEPLDPE